MAKKPVELLCNKMESIFYRGFWIDFLEKEKVYELLLDEKRIDTFHSIDEAKRRVDTIIISFSAKNKGV